MALYSFSVKTPLPKILVFLFVQFIVESNGQDSPNFAVNLFKNIVTSSSSSNQNIAISPFSVEAVLSMIYVGSFGLTRSELGTALGFGTQGKTVAVLGEKFKFLNVVSENFTLQCANALFLDQSFKLRPEYRHIITNKFQGNISTFNFATEAELARRQINGFVEEKTNRKIQNLFPTGSLGPETRLVLVNAIYFKADWQKKFDASLTTPQPFMLSNGRQKMVPLMSLRSKFLYNKNADQEGSQILELRYKKGEVSMIVILPDKKIGLSRWETNLTPESLAASMKNVTSRKVHVFLPKFKISKSLEFTDTLQAMGIKAAFTDGSGFPDICLKEGLKVSKVLQKVFVEVDEKGTTAAAATGAMIVPASMSHVSYDIFRADRPFIYLIRHNPTNSILFMGRVNDPTV